MADLAERIEASIENPNGELWFPELTANLAARAWDNLNDLGLTPDSYGTERVLSRHISAPREIITSLKTSPSAGAPTIAIEALTEERAAGYQKKGVCFYSPNEIVHTTAPSCIEDALAIVNQVPSLMSTVAVLVRSLHVIKPEDEEHDVSFSEPHAPFSIFVSVPEKRIADDRLRVAEAIVHEAMHLQLTLIEGIQPLVNRTEERYFSPWRGEFRNAQGLLHGLYVFRVIAQFLGNINVSNYSDPGYVSRRWSEIASETNQILSFSDCPELTCIGSRFVGRLFHPSL